VTARIAVLALIAIAVASGSRAAPDRLPADPPFDGLIWSYMVPAILFAVALGATVLLYRHFAGRDR
jgi:hypothetical protein